MKIISILFLIIINFSYISFTEASAIDGTQKSIDKIRQGEGPSKLKKVLTGNGNPVRTKNGHAVYLRPKK